MNTMIFTSFLLFAAAALLSVTSLPVKRNVDATLVPDFGVQQGVNPSGTGSCDGIDGANGQPIRIPCHCPPDRNTFLAELNANVAASHVLNNPSVSLSFPEDNSTASQLARIDACLVTLQNLNGTGVGCPASSTTWVAIQKSILGGGSSPAPSSAAQNSTAVATSAAAVATNSVCGTAPGCSSAAAATSAAASATPTASSSVPLVNANLVPVFGVQAGVNPDGTGNCDGVNGANGKPILIPCSCPPNRTSFIQELSANVAVGHVINNPTVQLSFPSDNSTASQLARLNAAAVTLQNLKGPGVGCPVASTTFSAQNKAILAGSS